MTQWHKNVYKFSNQHLQTIKLKYLDRNKRWRANFVRTTVWPPVARGQLEVSTASPCNFEALEAAQNPRLSAEEMTATQKLDLKQTHASSGAITFCANHRGQWQHWNRQLKLPHAGCHNTPGTDLQMIRAQTTGQKRNFKLMQSSDRNQ